MERMYFKKLNPTEEQEMKNWARKHYLPFDKIEGIWHPVCQQECVKINYEHSIFSPPEE